MGCLVRNGRASAKTIRHVDATELPERKQGHVCSILLPHAPELVLKVLVAGILCKIDASHIERCLK